MGGEEITDVFTAKLADAQTLMVSGLKGSSRTRVSRALTHLAMLGPAFDSIYYDAHVTVTTACSGTELAIWTLQRLMYSCSDRISMATTAGLRQLWAYDNGKLPMRGMKEVMQTPLVSDDINGLSEEWRNTVLLRKRLRKVQGGSLFATGFSCVDVSNYNTKRSQHKACISRGVGKTGGTFAGAIGHIQAFGPVMVLLENVRGIRGKNLKAVLFILRRLGYVCFTLTDCASDHYLPQRRTRVWIGAVLCPDVPTLGKLKNIQVRA